MTSPSPSSSAISTPSLSIEDVGIDCDIDTSVGVDKQDPALPVVESSLVESSVLKPKPKPTSRPMDQLRIDFSLRRITALTMLVLGPVATLVGLLAYGGGICIGYGEILRFNEYPWMGGDDFDGYKSRARTFMTGVSKVFEFILEILVGSACVGLFAKWSTLSESSLLKAYGPRLAVLFLGFLLSNGLTSIDVDGIQGNLKQAISDYDLARRVDMSTSAQLEDIQIQLLSPWNKTYAEIALKNRVINTALRTNFLPFQKIKTHCTGESANDSKYVKPTVVVTTQSEAWVLNALPNAIDASKTYSLYPQQPNDEVHPIDTSTTRTLFALAIIGLTAGDNALWSKQQSSKIVTNINQAIQYKATNPNCAVNETTTYGTILDCVSDESLPTVASQAFENMFQSAINSSAILRTHHIADSINFTSLTISYSVKLADETKTGDKLQCSEYGCTFVDTDETLKRGDQMVGIARLPGNATTKERLVVTSVGKRLEGDSFDVDETEQNVVLMGLRMHYTLTVGLLEWNIEPLDVKLGTECVATNSCDGLRVVNSFLSKWQIVLVGESELDFSDLPNVSKSIGMPVIRSLNDAASDKPMASPWIRLVSVISNHLVIALPRNFDTVRERVAEYFKSRKPSTCVASVARFLKAVEVNHLYIEDSLQISYTAAFHYLLQNAVLHAVTSEGRVIFHRQKVRVVVSIQQMNAIVSLTGCAVLFLMCVAVAICHKRSKRIIEANSNATNIAQAMLNDSMYPRAVLSLWLEQPNGEDKTTPRRVKLDDVVFDRAEFKDKPKPPPKKARKSVSTAV